MMKKLITVAICALLLFSKSENCAASHGVGGELTYTCLGGNNYRFHFTFYRDCDGIPADTIYNIAGVSTCGGSANFIVTLDSSKEISNTCLTTVTRCVDFNSP